MPRGHQLRFNNLQEDACTLLRQHSSQAAEAPHPYAEAPTSAWVLDAQASATRHPQQLVQQVGWVLHTLTVRLWPAVSGRSSPNFLNTAGCLSSVLIAPCKQGFNIASRNTAAGGDAVTDTLQVPGSRRQITGRQRPLVHNVGRLSAGVQHAYEGHSRWKAFMQGMAAPPQAATS